MEIRARIERRAIRFPVRFWRQDDVEGSFAGVVTNVSAGGAFISTSRVVPPNVAIDIEITQPTGTTVISANVVHAARYPPLYQQVFKSGMGVRFRHPTDPAVQEVSRQGVALRDRGGRRQFPHGF